MNKTNAMMSEKELDMVVGGWSREESINIAKQLLENSDHTVVYNGLKIQILKNEFEGGFGDLTPNIVKYLDSVEPISKYIRYEVTAKSRNIKLPCNEIGKDIFIKVSKA